MYPGGGLFYTQSPQFSNLPIVSSRVAYVKKEVLVQWRLVELPNCACEKGQQKKKFKKILWSCKLNLAVKLSAENKQSQQTTKRQIW